MRAIPLTMLLALGAAGAGADAVDDFVRSRMEREKIPGLSLAVVSRGQAREGQGLRPRQRRARVPARPETIYQSGSVGKQFTATAVMLLVEDGQDRPRRSDHPVLRRSARDLEGHHVRHLLTHTSGIKDWEGDEGHRLPPRLHRRRAAEGGDDAAARFPPGSSGATATPATCCWASSIRKAGGEFYGDFLRERVFQPLGMETARVISEADIVPNRAGGYQLVEGELKNQEWVSPSVNTTADGALYLTVLDLAKWDAGTARRPAAQARRADADVDAGEGSRAARPTPTASAGASTSSAAGG